MTPRLLLSEDALRRVLRSLVAAELAAGGRRIDAAEVASWPDGLRLWPDGLALDSLDLLRCATAANQLFHIHETGIEDYLLAEPVLDRWALVVRRALEEGVSGFTFHTSGSTGAPLPCTQPADILCDEAAFWAARYRGAARILQAVPAHHIYGCLFTALLPDALGIPVLDIRALAPGVLARTLGHDDVLVGHPAWLGLLPRAVPRLPAGLRIVSSTAPLPDATQRALRAAGAAEVTEVYGSSETAGIGWRCDPGAGFALLPRWRPGEAGDDASVIEAATGRAWPLPDRAAWEGATLRLLGRKDQAVQVGGINVFPARVAAALAAQPDVAECSVRLDATLAEPRLKAFIVPAPGADTTALAEALANWCRANLSAPERPVRFDVGTVLPRSALGKPADWSCAA